jgi:hypothetical protein
MKVILKYVVLPLLVLAGCAIAVKVAWDHSPTLVLSVIAGLLALGLIRGFFVRREDLKRGWRVGHEGRDQMFYEELVKGCWERVALDGEMLCGDSHHVIYFPSAEQWDALPESFRGRRNEIIARIKQAFTPPGYEYHEAEQAEDTNPPPLRS